MDNKQILLKRIKRSPNYIKFINNPSKELQIQAVKEIGYSIKYIKNPSIEIQKTAITQNPYCIEYIQDPIEEIQLLAISIAPRCFKLIKQPTDKVKEYMRNYEYNRLEKYRKQYDRIMELKDNEETTDRLSILMTKMEKEFKVPALNDEEWNQNHKEVIELYRKISDTRKFN